MSKRIHWSATTLLIGLLPFVGGCGPPKADREIVVLCGSSFRPPTEKLAQMFEAQTGIAVKMSFGGSEDHLPHVKAKRVGDVYVTHTPFMQYTDDAGSLLREVKGGFPVSIVTRSGSVCASCHWSR